MGENENEEVKNELKERIENELLKEEEEVSEEEGEEEEISEGEISTEKIAEAFRGISLILSRKFEIPEIELTDQDVQDLASALLPLRDTLSKYSQYFPYLPLIIFVLGYSARVIIGIRKKREGQSVNVQAKS